MIRSLIYSITFHSLLVLLTILSLPFMLREPIDLPPIVSVELIQITDKTSIPYAPKARKIIEETKKKEERVVSEQAPPAAKAKEKPDRIPLPDEKKIERDLVKKKQNPEEIEPQIRQSSEFEKKEIIDTNQIAALIDKAKKVEAVETKKTEEHHRNIISLAKRNITILNDQLAEIGLRLKIHIQKIRLLLMALISLSRHPRPSPISSTLLPLSIKRTKTLIKFISKQLNEEISNLEASSKKFSKLKNSLSIETQKIRVANKHIVLLH